MASKIYIDEEVGNVTISKNSRGSRIYLRVYPDKGVRVTIPYYVTYQEGVNFFLSKKEWVKEVMARIKASTPENSLPEEQKAELIENLRRRAKVLLPIRVGQFASSYGFSPNRVFIKHNSSNWGSCSSKGNINLNLNLVRLPQLLQDFIIIHELCHLKYQNHGEDFHDLVEKICQDHYADMYKAGDEYAVSLYPEIQKTHAQHPVEHVLEKSLKLWRLI